MTFDELLAQVLDLLQRQGRVSYRALKRRFALDDDYLEDLKAEIIKAQRLAVDEDGEVGAHDQAIAAAQRALTLAVATGDIVLHALANGYLGATSQAQGDYRRAIDCCGQTMASFKGVGTHLPPLGHGGARYGGDG
jgi:hypothetical protein